MVLISRAALTSAKVTLTPVKSYRGNLTTVLLLKADGSVRGFWWEAKASLAASFIPAASPATLRRTSNSVGEDMSITKRATAEFFGTFWLVFGGCGSAVLAAAF